MKKAMLAIMIVFALVLAMAGSAALVVTSPTVGSKNDDRGKTVTGTFTVQNTENDTVSSLTISNTANAKYNVSFSGLPAFLNASQTVTVTASVFISKDHPAVDSVTLKEAAIDVADITVSGTKAGATISGKSDLFVQAKNQLKVKKIRVSVEGGKSDSVDEGDKVDDLKPGDKLDVEVEVENRFSDNDDVDFDNVNVEIKSDDDDDVDVDDDEDIDVSADDEEIVKFSDLEVEDDASDGTVKVTVRASGNDDNGALHGEEIQFKLEINRESHEIRIDSATLRPTTVACEGDRTIRADVRATNIGRNDEDDVVIEADVPGLGFNERRNIGSLDEDDSGSASFSIPVAKTVKPGAYQATFSTYWETSIKSQSKSFTVTVADCTVKDEKPVVVTPPVQTPPATQPPVVVPPATPTVPRAPVKTSSFTDSPGYVALLAVAAVIVLLTLVFLVVKLTRKE